MNDDSSAPNERHRATIFVAVDDVTEVEASKKYFTRWASALTFISENLGCGCCVDCYEVEGPAEAIEAIPAAILSSKSWESGKRS